MAKPNPLLVVEARFAENLKAAQIIAAEPDRYAGIMLEWARMILAPAKRPAQVQRSIGDPAS